MKIGILGTGKVGQALAAGFLGLDHEVKLGTREPWAERVRVWAAQAGAKASAGSFSDAARFGEIVVLATAWAGTANALRIAEPANLRGKVVVDVTNPLELSNLGPPKLAIGHTDSGGEQVQRWLPGARVVKCFNSVGHAQMVKPRHAGGPPSMFLCGDDPAAKKIVGEICQAFGWLPLDIGGIEGARLLEPLCVLWVAFGFRTNTWDHAFKLLRG
jgi:8-hydroxy-5-deazaflavin:NADPH oxidoreductase